MSPDEWNDESRSALADMNEFERMAGCSHLFGQYGGCAFCDSTAEEAGY